MIFGGLVWGGLIFGELVLGGLILETHLIWFPWGWGDFTGG